MTSVAIVIQPTTVSETESHEVIVGMTVKLQSPSQVGNLDPRRQNLGLELRLFPAPTTHSSIGTLAGRSHVDGEDPLFG